ncbi:MAG TPA: signal peptidase II [Candidatus Nanoarchaeia archaeon]|nr:signal peptidase II [Candidatus Nanoarchaeia archaeon]
MVNKFWIISIIILFIDQITKYIAQNTLAYVTNTGASFGILYGNNTLLSILAIIIMLALIYYQEQEPHFAYPFIMGGLLGNLTDRILYGHVIDFIKLPYITFPYFNIADTATTIGGILLLYSLGKELYQRTIQPKKHLNLRN